MLIEANECISQDMLLPSAAAGKVRAQYPRGSKTVLTIDDAGTVSVQPDTNDGAWQQATILPSGSLQYLSDQPASKPTIVLGANLKAL